MGFEVHITRGGDPLENIEPVPITLDEWRAALGTEVDLVELSGDKPGQATWKREGADSVSFDFHDGHITVTDPDEETLEKAARLANTLGAHLHGEDGEEYDTSGHLAFDPGDEVGLREMLETQSKLIEELTQAPEPEDLKAIKQPWWKRLLG